MFFFRNILPKYKDVKIEDEKKYEDMIFKKAKKLSENRNSTYSRKHLEEIVDYISIGLGQGVQKQREMAMVPAAKAEAAAVEKARDAARRLQRRSRGPLTVPSTTLVLGGKKRKKQNKRKTKRKRKSIKRRYK